MGHLSSPSDTWYIPPQHTDPYVRQLRALVPYLRPYRASIALGIAMVLISNALSVVSLEFVKSAVDVLEGPGGSAARIARYAALSVGVAVLAGIARYVMRQQLNGVSRRVENDLRDDFFSHLLRLDASFYGTHPTGEIMSRATNDIQAVRMVAGPAYMYLVNTVVFSLFALTRMFWIDGWMTVTTMLPMLLLPPVTLWFGKVIHERFEGVQEQFGVLSTMTQENLAGVRIVKAYGQEGYQTGRFTALARTYMDLNVALARTSGLFYPSLGFLAGLAMALALWLGGNAILAGRITVGDFVLFTLYLGMLSWPMIALGWVVNLFQRGAASMGRVSRILAAEPLIREPELPAAPAVGRGEVEFRSVSFRYPGSQREVLRDISFRVPAGSTLAIVGATGSGKSTVVALMTRLYDPTGGEVLLDGVPLPRWPLARLRSAVATVPQDTFLFSASIRENLALGIHEGPVEEEEDRIRAAAAVARLQATIDDLPAGYDTVLGERGINLSGGQKQRAALARALASGAEVLVLDDALSAVDTHTEFEILEGLRGVLARQTSIIVSHRATAVMQADLILVMEEGEIVEQGTHAELVQRNGAYATLQRRQLLRDAVEGNGVLAPTFDEV